MIDLKWAWRVLFLILMSGVIFIEDTVSLVDSGVVPMFLDYVKMIALGLNWCAWILVYNLIQKENGSSHRFGWWG